MITRHRVTLRWEWANPDGAWVVAKCDIGGKNLRPDVTPPLTRRASGFGTRMEG